MKVASLPEGLDPDEYIAKYGKESFEKILDQGQDLIAFHTALQLNMYPQPLGAQDKTRIVTELAETIGKQPDEIVRREWAKYAAEHVGVDEALVLERLRRPAIKTPFAHKQEVHSAAPVTAPAEEELASWLLRAPQHAALCAELTQNDFSTVQAWKLFEAVRKAASETLDAQTAAQKAAEYAPERKNDIVRLALFQPPQDAEPARDIAACAAKLAHAGLQKRLEEVKRQMKRLGAGNVPQEIFQEYMQLQTKLKK